ncbi:MAG TPA: formate/nitrite transporter family protein [Candidatus Anaerobiospirillum pullistercoris]|uniref:Formate/nitrite transporter family protein n=1 Tax=Candidatus Anaerobiospirillum pullistercoris TaxID=2838452 RepID=A0A9D1WEL6_9GAMM|nr:formate/nitrite transporter family protein [Candidatus Anaerobiospirillum pullistercoris]
MMHSTFYQFTIKSLLAGILIGLGCVIYVASPIKYVGTFLFSLGLMTILIKGYYLYTGKVGDFVPSATLRLIYMFVLNGIACGATTYLFTLTRIDLSAIDHVVEAKLNDTMLSSFILAMGCGAMMHIAYYCFSKGKHPLYVIMPIMFFMLAGFEHCVANCGFFAMGKVNMVPEHWLRLALIVIGNGVGSMIFTKFLPPEDPSEVHGVPPLFDSDNKHEHHPAVIAKSPSKDANGNTRI